MEQGAQCPQESAGILEQLFRGHQHHNDEGALCQVFWPVRSTVQPIPATLLTVATLVTVVVFVVVCTVLVIFACLATLLAFKVVKQALGRVAQLVALVVDVLPAGQRGGAIGPGVFHGEGTVPPVPLAGMAVAHVITDAVPSFVGTILAQAGGGRGAGGGAVEFTVAAPEGRGTLARVVRRLALRVAAPPVLAGATGAARVAVLGVGAEAAGARGRVHTLLPSPALHLSAAALAPHPREARGTATDETIGHVAGHSTSASIQARHLGTHVDERFTVTTSEGAAADAQVVIGELNAVQAALRAARAGQALVDVPLAAFSSKAWQAATTVAPNPVYALATIKAVGTSGTVVNVLFTKQAPSAWWTGALEVVHKVDTGASILAWLVLALIHFILAVDTLISRDTLTSVSTNEVPAGGAVLAGIGRALIKLVLTVAPGVAQGALAVMRVARADTDAGVLAQAVNGHPSAGGRHLTGDTGNIAVSTSPSRRTQAPRLCFILNAGTFVFTWRPTAEVHQGLTVFSSIAQWTDAAVGTQAINTYSFIQAWMRVAFIDLMEAEGTSEAHRAQAREGVNPIDTRATIETGALSALVNVVLTVDSIKSRLALAGVTVDIVRAGPSVLTGLTQTLIHVCLTFIPSEARKAQAGESIHSIYTGTSILARIGKAVINVLLTVHAAEAWRTFAHVAALGVMAETVVHAGLGHTLINVDGTPLTLPARSTQAGVTLKIWCLFANTSILTRVWGTGSQHGLTVLACVRQHTVASITAYVIKAGSLVQTWIRSTFINIHLAVIAFKALLASTPVSIHQIVTSSPVLAWIRKTFIFVHFTVDANPACITEALVSSEAPSTVSVDTGIAQALVHL